MSPTLTLVGAGPGDPGLLTVAGREALERAQVVAYDALVNPAIVALAPGEAERIPVTRRHDPGAVPQSEIVPLLARRAQAGLRVVRLKGGDPFVFGRGREEADALEALGVKVRAIPGISSALAAGTCTGAGLEGEVHILSGKPRSGEVLRLDYPALARVGGTLVFLMALERLGEICAGLQGAGLAGETPAALVEQVTTPRQRRVEATLATLTQVAAEQKLCEPTVVLIGR